ncbi:MAG: photosystem I assembly protein Ycf3 [candidate division BRC1 bacterium ADurb.BinA364]|nr:MAG: photosystem I assembly protein Ycf3 [candidate division BRC1 bacterium ADurb.BinA364]
MEAIYDDHPLVASRAIRSLSQYLNSNVASALAPMAADERLAVKLEAISTLNRGWRLLDPENLQLLEDRKQDYLDWLKLLADDPFSYYNLGVFRMDEGRPEEALDAYAQSEALGFEETPLYVNWGMALDQTGDSEGAEDKFLKALQRDPRFAEGHFALGLLYAARPNGLGKAIQSLERAVAIKSDFARAHYNLGLAYNQAGRALEAVRSLRRAMAADPTMFEAPYALATIYYAAQQWDRAREAALQALAIQPESREAWALLDELERRQAQP